MRLITPFVLTALSVSIVACGKPTPVPVPFDNSSAIFRGAWSGTLKDNGEPEVRVNVVATYISSKSYAVNGVLTFKDVAYNLTGQVEAGGGAYLTSQTSQLPPSFHLTANLSLNDKVVGTLSGYQDVRRPGESTIEAYFKLETQPFTSFNLKRVQ